MSFLTDKKGAALIGFLVAIIIIAALMLGSSFFWSTSSDTNLTNTSTKETNLFDALEQAKDDIADINDAVDDRLQTADDSMSEEAGEQIMDNSKQTIVNSKQEEWQTYRNEEFGFEFQYPSAFSYNDYISNGSDKIDFDGDGHACGLNVEVLKKNIDELVIEWQDLGWNYYSKKEYNSTIWKILNKKSVNTTLSEYNFIGLCENKNNVIKVQISCSDREQFEFILESVKFNNEEAGGDTFDENSLQSNVLTKDWKDVIRENEGFRIKYHKDWYYTVNRREAAQDGFDMIIGFGEDPMIWEMLPPYAIELVIAPEHVEWNYDGYSVEFGVINNRKYVLRTLDGDKYGEIVDLMAGTFVDTSKWLTYRDEEFGLEFLYPGEFFIKEDNKTSKLFKSNSGHFWIFSEDSKLTTAEEIEDYLNKQPGSGYPYKESFELVAGTNTYKEGRYDLGVIENYYFPYIAKEKLLTLKFEFNFDILDKSLSEKKKELLKGIINSFKFIK